LKAIAAACGIDHNTGRFAGDLTLSDDDDWQDLLDMYRDEDEEPDALERSLGDTGMPEHVPDGQLVLHVAAYPISGRFERDDRQIHVLIPESPNPDEIHQVFDDVLPDFGYRIQEDAH